MLIAVLVISILNFFGIFYVLLVLNNAFKFTNNRIDFYANSNVGLVKKADEIIVGHRKLMKDIVKESP